MPNSNQPVGASRTSVSIVIPAYNEEKRLPATLDSILEYLNTRSFSAEVIVIDDGSTDGTADLVRKYQSAHTSVRLLSNPGNRGKGYAVRNGITRAETEWVLFTDADLSTPICELATLLNIARSRHSDIVIGSRALDRSMIRVRQSAFRECSGRIFNLAVRLSTGMRFADTQCGFKLFHREAAAEVFRRQLLDGFSFDVESLLIATRLGYKIVETPVEWSNVEGTKVSAIHGLKSFGDLLRIKWFDVTGKYSGRRRQQNPLQPKETIHPLRASNPPL